MVTHALPTRAKVPTAMITKTTKQMLTDATGPQKRDKIMVEISFKIFHHNQTPYKLKKKSAGNRRCSPSSYYTQQAIVESLGKITQLR